MSAVSDPGFLEALGPVASEGALAGIRRAGRERFAESGFPSRRSEAWRFTDLKPLIQARFAEPTTHGIEALDDAIAAAEPSDRLVFVNGRLDAARSRVGELPARGFAGSFADWAETDREQAAALFDLEGGAERAFLSLNAALFTDGPTIIAPDGVVLERPVHVFYWNSGAASHLKSLVRLGAGAQAELRESFIGTGSGWTNIAATVELADGAQLGRFTVQDESLEAFHTNHLTVSLGTAARLDAFLLTCGARLARQDTDARLAGAGAFCGYSGGYLLSGRQEAAVHSIIQHAAPNGRTREIFKGCLGDRAHGIFQGKIRVERLAQKTDAHQLNKTILLGERAVMDTKPELEIYADDVKCSHGATVGDLDETALFYIRSRGIAAEAARRMLIEAFVLDAVETVESEGARRWLSALVAARLGRLG